MTERQLQFRVGLFVVIAIATGVVLTVQFGKLERYYEPRYVVEIEYDVLTGVHPGTPVQQSGIPVGRVTDVAIDRKSRKVIVTAEIRERYPLASDARPQVVQSLLGESHIEFSVGTGDVVAANHRFNGVEAQDPFEAMQRLESRLTDTVEVFADTSREWQMVARNVNSLLETNEGKIDLMVEQAAMALRQLTVAMQKASVTLDEANSFIADPELQLAVKEAMVALPQLIKQTELLVQQTQHTIGTTNNAVASLGKTMDNLETMTTPLAANSDQLMASVASSMNSLNSTLHQLNQFSKQLNEGDGSLQRLSRDPQLYQNLQFASSSLAALLKNLDPIVRDMQVFSDKVARHPEVLGVSGYLKGSSGVKEATITPASSTAPSNIKGRASGFRPFGGP